MGAIGDFNAFAYLNSETKQYNGYYIDTAKKLAELTDSVRQQKIQDILKSQKEA